MRTTEQHAEQRWIRFDDGRLQSLLRRKAELLGVNFSVGDDDRIYFNDDDWCHVGNPDILTLDDEFGKEWVAVYANDSKQRTDRIGELRGRGVRFVVWLDSANGTSIVMERTTCPPEWEYA